MDHEMYKIVIGAIFRFFRDSRSDMACMFDDDSLFPEEADNTQPSNIACEDITQCTPLMSSSIHSSLIS